MDKYEKKTRELLHKSGANLVRQRRHIVYKLQDGRIFVCSKTPSDWRASRRTFADLKSLVGTALCAAESDVQGASISPHDASQQSFRFKPPSRQSYATDSDFKLVFASAPRCPPIAEPAFTRNKFESTEELLFAVKQSESFWALDYSGRIKLLQKFASRFAKVAVLTVRFNLMEIVEKPEKASKRDFIDTLNRVNFRTNWQYQYKEWGLSGLPALFVDDPHLGPIVIDVSGLPIVTKCDDIAVMPADFDEEGTFCTHWPIWNGDVPESDDWSGASPDKFIAYTFFTSSGMRKWGVTFAVAPSWSDENKTREARNELLGLMRNS